MLEDHERERGTKVIWNTSPQNVREDFGPHPQGLRLKPLYKHTAPPMSRMEMFSQKGDGHHGHPPSVEMTIPHQSDVLTIASGNLT